MQRSLWKRLGLINKSSHRATAKQRGPCMAGCLSQQIYSKSLRLVLSQGCWSVRSLPGSQVQLPPSSGNGVSKHNLFFFFSSKCGGEIMNVETLTCAENWIDCLHI